MQLQPPPELDPKLPIINPSKAHPSLFLVLLLLQQLQMLFALLPTWTSGLHVVVVVVAAAVAIVKRVCEC